jgi:hypothetical protein
VVVPILYRVYIESADSYELYGAMWWYYSVLCEKEFLTDVVYCMRGIPVINGGNTVYCVSGITVYSVQNLMKR